MRPATTSWLLGALLLVASPRLQAEEGRPPPSPHSARLLLPHCPAPGGLDTEALIEVLGVELLGQGVTLGGGELPTVRLILDLPRCDPAASILLRVESSGGRAVERTLQVEDATDRERVLALALSELLRQEWPALSAALPVALPVGPPIQPPPGPGPEELSAEERAQVLELIETRPRPQPAAPAPPPRLLADVAIDGRIIPSYVTGLFGASAGISIQLGEAPVRVEVDGGLWYGLARDPLGQVDLMAATGAAALLFGSRRRPWRAGLGPRVELGWCGAWGRPYDPSTTTAGSGGAFLATISLEATLRLPLTTGRLRRRLFLLIDSALGYILSGLEARAADRTSAALEGFVISWSLGLSIGGRPPR